MTTKHSSATHGSSGGRRLARALVACTVAGTALVAYVAEAQGAQPSRAAGERVGGGAGNAGITWGACPALAEGQTRDPRLTCGTLHVPLDYRHPGGAKIDVAVSRLSTAAPGKRRGVLLLNPGGPALGGLDMPGTMAPTLPKTVLDRYDLIGFDPRGVEHSTPQSCGLNDPGVPGLFPYPAADGSITKNVALAKADAKRCADTVGKNLRYYSTANTARDMDRIRQALGEKKISYWGQSYGTYLGTVYRSLFRKHTDRMILEGNVDPTKVWADEVADTWGKGMADRFPDAARVAAAQNGTLGLGASVAQVTRTYLALADRLDRAPATIPGAPVPLDGALLRNVTYGLLLHNETLPVLAQFWKAADDLAHGTTTAADAEVLAQVFADTPTSPGVPADNQATMFMALTCGDAEWPHDVDGYAARTAADRAKWPLTAGMPANIWSCAFWDKPAEATVRVTKGGPRNTLILQNRRDNATPWEGGVGLRRALGDGSVLVGVDNGGHYVYDEGSACADKATVDFLVTGHLPGRDRYCTDVVRRK
ncbi:pimeloyl-ACP methyl ester carboxylesterase [Streptomyces sp. B3I7]|uniref:alpha/beta hydrolase n=1 Tax=Streptomyces sp. B3I7 TaxID=3042269 RepID=UPI0027819BB4|nr:alpha/beta hydrolase [Streptomyces sp. B3I7]MDQ0812207.1 pimeloyl-ACP methyl ester carboxylesterase [Streptomyces sp. B3I7]